MSDLPRSRATAVQALIDRLKSVAEKYRKPGYMSSDVLFAEALDPIITDLAALLLREGPAEPPPHWLLEKVRFALDEARRTISVDHPVRIHVEGAMADIDFYELMRAKTDEEPAALREGQEPDWIGKCPKCNRTVLNHGDLCSQCAGLKEGPPQEPNMSESTYYDCCDNFGTHLAKCTREALRANRAGLREGQEPPAARLHELAIIGARKAHNAGTEAAGHVFPYKFETCPHPDCVLVRQPAGLREGPPAPQEEHNRVKFSQTDMDAQTKPLHVEIERLRGEIADAREACPSIRMQDNFDAPLLKLVNLEVSRGFNRDAEIYKLRALLPHSGPPAPYGHAGEAVQEAMPDHCENCRAETPVTTVHLCHACLPSAPSEHAGEAPATEPAHVECTASPSGKHQSFAGRRGWCEWCSQEFTPDASVCRDGHLIARASGRCIDCGINCSELAASQAGTAPRNTEKEK